MEEQKIVGEWDNYLKNFLKTDDVTSEDQPFVIVSMEEVDNRDERVIRLHLETNQVKYIFDLNKTNTVFLKENGIKHPTEAIGKKVYFKIVQASNPSIQKEVPALRIAKIE